MVYESIRFAPWDPERTRITPSMEAVARDRPPGANTSSRTLCAWPLSRVTSLGTGQPIGEEAVLPPSPSPPNAEPGPSKERSIFDGSEHMAAEACWSPVAVDNVLLPSGALYCCSHVLLLLPS